jgi:Pyruvate/2-oxoacid:ferredoxin oxidoreductase delta subunit
MSGVQRLGVLVADAPDAPRLDAGARTELFRTLLDAGYAVSRMGSPNESLPAPATPQFVLTVDGSVAAVDAAAVLARVEEANRAAENPLPGAWKPWFPVIDYSRCTNCMQCLSFCLFDVYGVTPDRQIQVQNPSNCKTECPACSRVCPEVAIMFPKYRHAPINGDVVSTDDVRREAMKIDISSLLGGDVYAALRDRSAKAKSRFSKERDEDRALKERQTCLVKLQQQMNVMDVPPEVIASLPGPEEIRRRAEVAAARAAAALAPSTAADSEGAASAVVREGGASAPPITA